MGGSIAVGFGGVGGSEALAWATEQAERSGARLTIVHVCVPGSPLTGATHARLELLDPPLARVYAKAQTCLGGHRVALEIRSGDPAAELVHASAGAHLLVIGAGEGGRTVRRIIRHTHSPVVVVRPTRLPAHAPFAGHVVVGVDGSPAGRAAVEFAFAYAAEHQLPLAAAHASTAEQDDYFYDDVTLSTHFAVEPAALELLAAETEPWSLKYPDVPVRRAVLHGPVDEALIQAAAGARLVVVGDKRRGVIGRARTGDVPLTVATEAACPVAVVPEDHDEGDLL
ncbi:MAG TPA: universal stress protein [Actinoplanes sp.]|nr:universal stress protein [Actinoplanes sp.]